MSVKCISPHTSFLFSENEMYRGKYSFLIFLPKHRLWVLDVFIFATEKTLSVYCMTKFP